MKLLFTFLAFVMTVSMWAQQGTISGTVIDESLGETLIGANVVIDGTATGTSTDIDGKYQFSADPGTYTILVTYIGFSDKKIEGVEVKAGETTYLDINMDDSAVELGVEVVVQAKAIERSENAVLMLQKKSDKIMDGISSQEMSKYSLSNVANAMTKVSGATVSGGKYIYIRGLGDRYSSTQLNGLPLPSTDPYRNTPQLDLIPTNLLDNIITSKSFTPDLPANFTGGNVDIRTKTLPEQFFLTFSTKFGYNRQNNLIDNFLTYDGPKGDYLGFSNSERQFPDFIKDPEFRKTYLTTNANISARRDDEFASKMDQAIKSIPLDFVPTNGTSPVDHQMRLTMGNQYKINDMSLGMILSGSFKKNYTNLPDFARRNWQLRIDSLQNWGDYVEQVSTEEAVVNGIAGLALKINNLNTISLTTLYNHSGAKSSRYSYGERPDQLRGDLRYVGRALEFRERSLLNIQLAGQHAVSNWKNTEIDWSIAQTNSSQDEPMNRYFENAENLTANADNGEIQFFIPQNSVQFPSFYFRDLEDKQLTGKLDVIVPFSKIFKMKVGGLYVDKDRTFNEDLFQIYTDVNADQFTGSFDDFFATDNIGIIGKDPNRGWNLIGNYLASSTNQGNSYSGYEKITSGYGMVTVTPIEKLKLITGLRVEKTDIEVKGNSGKPEDVGRIDETDLFPVGNLIYSLTEDMNLRASYSRTIARPNMREISPFEFYDPLTATFIYGNPDLQRTLIDNYDLRWEYFFGAGEIISASAYYKDFENPIQQKFLPSSNREIVFSNVPNATVLGVEMEFRKNLGFISPFFERMKFNSNFSFITSESDVDSVSIYTVQERPFEGQANFIMNTALLYSDLDRGLDANLAYNYVGRRLAFIGDGGNPDIYQSPIGQLDFTLQKSWENNFGVILTVQNILNAETKFSSEYNGKEYLDNRYKRGTTFKVGLSYTFR